MLNTKLFSLRNVLIIGVFAIVWQVMFARVNAFLHADATTQVPDAQNV